MAPLTVTLPSHAIGGQVWVRTEAGIGGSVEVAP